MANTIGTSTLSEVWRIKYFKTTLELALRTALVAEKVCNVDRTDAKYISNPYLTGATAAIAAIAGTYAVSTATTTDDALTVSEQVTYGVHLFEFEASLSRADLYTSFVEDMTNAVAVVVDKYVLNKILDDATTLYDTPTGGFTTASNINEIIANLVSKVAGYADAYKGMFLVIENTDLPGFIQAGMSNGFSFADSALNNGFGGRYGGVDVYVVRTGTFVTGAVGTLTAANAGHRLFGVKGVATFAFPRGVQYQEKEVTLKTGKEIGVWANIGAKCWTPKAALLVDITLK
jgi:hypothetical protein